MCWYYFLTGFHGGLEINTDAPAPEGDNFLLPGALRTRFHIKPGFMPYPSLVRDAAGVMLFP